MGAEVPFKVIIKKIAEEEVVIHAITSSEAEEKALRLPGVMEAKIKGETQE